MARCKATTKSGDRCKREVGEGSDYCYQHQNDGSGGAYKFDSNTREKFLDILEKGATKTTAADAVGISTQTVYDHIDKNPEFAQKVQRATAKVDKNVERKLYMEAMNGNFPAIMKWLHNRRPEAWRDNEDGNKQSVNVNVNQEQRQAQKAEFDEKFQKALENDPELRETYKKLRRRTVEIK